MPKADQLVILIAKLFSWMITTSGRGAGATWPGEIALRLRPHILHSFMSQQRTIIFICGTNGKTTTAKMIHTILKKNHKSVYRNESGANLDNGIVSTFIKNSTVTGKLKSAYYIFEVDEATVPLLLSVLTPQIIVLLNVFRDQLDRCGEVDTIVEKWRTSLQKLPKSTHVLINGDDPALAHIGTKLSTNVVYFGLNDPELFLSKTEHATDSIYCPECGQRLTFGGTYFSHLGKFACGKCGFMHPHVSITSKDITSPLEGVYNRYNVLAATLVGRTLGFQDAAIAKALESFTPAFGRMESVSYEGKNVRILLSKNPTGWNESLRTVLSSEKQGPVLLVLNDRIPDGRDVSWIWDTDIEMISATKNPIIVAGDRCYDLAVRLKHAGIEEKNMSVIEHLENAVQKAITVTKSEETLWILPTYSAMLEVRNIIVGRKIL